VPLSREHLFDVSILLLISMVVAACSAAKPTTIPPIDTLETTLPPPSLESTLPPTLEPTLLPSTETTAQIEYAEDRHCETEGGFSYVVPEGWDF